MKRNNNNNNNIIVHYGTANQWKSQATVMKGQPQL